MPVRRIAQTLGLIRDPAARAGSAERPIRVLLLASIVLPVLVFAIAATISYHQHFADARDRLQRNLNRITEHAIKVFETFELSSRYLEELLINVPNNDIREYEAEYSARLKAAIADLPQLRDLWVIDADGYPVVSGTVFPMPRIDLSDREYFRVHKNGEATGPYVDTVVQARAANTKFFAITRRREMDGKFAGVILVSIAPEYFVDYYSKLPVSESNSSALLRADGSVLARYPEAPGQPTKVPSDGLFMRTLRVQPDAGFVTSRSSFDGVERTFAYRRLPRHPVYVVASFSTQAVVMAWMRDTGSHLIFGIPATATMFALGVIALGRTRRLQQEVAKRETTEQALRQAQKMEAVGRLSGGVAHDFNNMLTVILGNIDIALQRLGDGSPRVQRALDAARQASERAASLVQRLLAFSRQHPLEVKAVDINRLVQNMSELLRRTIGEQITIETVLGGGLWRTAVDPNQLENAVLNLAVNARDAMVEGGQLTIETANSYLDENYVAAVGGDIPHGQYVMLAISDTGVGMARDILERAFEPFFTTKPVGMGTGLGLSMVYGFAKQSAGHVKIYSESGEGTTVKIYFPRLAERADVPSWPSDEPGVERKQSPTGRETILLVEDDQEVNRFATEVLSEHGYRVLSATDGPAALTLLESDNSIALLLTDVVLPKGMNGRQLADEIRRRRPTIKVLYATGYTRNAIIHQGKLDPDVELLTKPFTAETLSRKIRQILDSQPAKLAI